MLLTGFIFVMVAIETPCRVTLTKHVEVRSSLNVREHVVVWRASYLVDVFSLCVQEFYLIRQRDRSKPCYSYDVMYEVSICVKYNNV